MEIKWQKKKLKQIIRKDTNHCCHNPDWYRHFLILKIKTGEFNLVLLLAKPLTCMTVTLNNIKMPSMCEQNKQAQ